MKEHESLVTREWLATNGLGGYAAGTIAGVCTRRFHGLLVAALPAPLGRMMMLNHVAEELVRPDGGVIRLGGDELSEDRLEYYGAGTFAGFRLEHGLPVWRYQAAGFTLERALVLPHLQNTVYLRYRLLAGPESVRLRVRPSFHFRRHESRVDTELPRPYQVSTFGARIELRGEPELPALRLLVYGDDASFLLDGGRFREVFYRLEHSRGYDARGTLWSPGYARAALRPGGEASLCASTEPWEILEAMDPESAFAVEHARRERLLAQAHPAARSGPASQLVLAADQFVITPNMRVIDAARTRAAGDDTRSVIAGYPWFTDWGRDTMISLEGLTLLTGRQVEAGYILRTFARHARDGLIPNYFPEGRQEGVYHTA
ncbi:MAG TPA: glycogen debranching enzyme N-terminal domain-containing protein, partial [Elusimicrobiota bacterium]|nr:glycogen debranching enzyme N-terminal domain-containing protein [Elusimicrobiota bacterium]